MNSTSPHSSKIIAKRVKQAREEADRSQKDVAKRLGLTEAGYGHYERDRQTFTVEQLFVLADYLGKPVTWFLGIMSKPGELADDEQHLLSMYRRAKEAGMSTYALGVMEALTKSLKE